MCGDWPACEVAKRLTDEDVDVRCAAARTLAKLPGSAAYAADVAALLEDEAPRVRRAAVREPAGAGRSRRHVGGAVLL